MKLLEEDITDTTTQVSGYEDSVVEIDTNYHETYTGFFKPPTTASYTFYMTCDDSCTLELDGSTIINVGGAMTFRNYHAKASGYFSETVMKSSAISLTQGQYYAIKGSHT